MQAKQRSRKAEYFSQVPVTNRRDEAHIWNSFVFLAGCVLLGMVSSILTYFSDLRFNSSPSMRCENKIFFRMQSKFSPSSCNHRYQEVAPPQNTFSGHLHNAKILNRNAFAWKIYFPLWKMYFCIYFKDVSILSKCSQICLSVLLKENLKIKIKTKNKQAKPDTLQNSWCFQHSI